MIIFGAGIIGEVTLAACREKGVPVECFLDARVEGPIQGMRVIKPDSLSIVDFDTHFLLTSPNIKDMIDPLWYWGYANWDSCGKVIKGFDISSVDWSHTGYSTEHVKYLVRTALHHHQNYMQPELLSVQSIDLVITEKCTMKCKDCSNLMQYYENPENQDLNEILNTVDKLSQKMDEIYEFRVIGGEPFVNKDIHIIVEKLTSKDNIRKVSIFTNATIVPREHQWVALTHEKVRLFITDYKELSRNLKPLIAELEKRGIAYVSEEANDWTECATLEKHGRTIKENEKLFTDCCAKNLATIMDARLYRCPFSAHATKLHAVPDYREDYLVVENSTREEIKSFLREKTWIKTCDHCAGRSYGDKLIEPAIQIRVPLKYRKYSLKELHGA